MSLLHPEGVKPKEDFREQPNLDLQWVLRVMDARDRVSLEDLVNANPGKTVVLPSENMGYVPNGD